MQRRPNTAREERVTQDLVRRLGTTPEEDREPLSHDAISRMPLGEIIERMDEIDAWQAAGAPEPSE